MMIVIAAVVQIVKPFVRMRKITTRARKMPALSLFVQNVPRAIFCVVIKEQSLLCIPNKKSNKNLGKKNSHTRDSLHASKGILRNYQLGFLNEIIETGRKRRYT
jgi:hypothetical protein